MCVLENTIFAHFLRFLNQFLRMQTPAANQMRRTRNRRNRCNRRNSTNQATDLHFEPKLKYSESSLNGNGLFVVTKRKRPVPTPEDVEAKKMRLLQVQQRKYFTLSLRHKVVTMWLHGANFNQWQFAAGHTRRIIEFLQESYPKYANFDAAKSFVYRAIVRFREADPMPSADPFRDLRGENKPKQKRKNARIVQLVDELVSEPRATAPKIRRGLRNHGFTVSLSTIYRIMADLSIGWTKPWHTDILTPAQKYKRKLFCAQLLRLSEQALLQLISRWCFTDEKWWDIIGPAAYKYCRGETKTDRKLQNQVRQCVAIFLIIAWFCLCHVMHACRWRGTKQKRRHQKEGLLLGRPQLAWQNAGRRLDCGRHQGDLQTHKKFVCGHAVRRCGRRHRRGDRLPRHRNEGWR